MKILPVILIALFLSGCMLDRFWARDESETRHQKLERLGLVEPGTTPAEDQYKYEYSFWNNWMDDLVDNLSKVGYISGRSQNNRRILKAAIESQERLKNMRALLLEDKRPGLDPHLAQMDEAIELLSGTPSDSRLKALSRVLAREKRDIYRNWRFTQIRDYIDITQDFSTKEYEEETAP